MCAALFGLKDRLSALLETTERENYCPLFTLNTNTEQYWAPPEEFNSTLIRKLSQPGCWLSPASDFNQRNCPEWADMCLDKDMKNSSKSQGLKDKLHWVILLSHYYLHITCSSISLTSQLFSWLPFEFRKLSCVWWNTNIFIVTTQRALEESEALTGPQPHYKKTKTHLQSSIWGLPVISVDHDALHLCNTATHNSKTFTGGSDLIYTSLSC